MARYVTLDDARKLQLLKEHSFQAPFPALDQKNWCLHCEKEYDGHSVRVWEDGNSELWLECGTPDCNGSPIDWAPYPWWDPDHPATKRYIKENGEDPSVVEF